jgi:hypothetical protein
MQRLRDFLDPPTELERLRAFRARDTPLVQEDTLVRNDRRLAGWAIGPSIGLFVVACLLPALSFGADHIYGGWELLLLGWLGLHRGVCRSAARDLHLACDPGCKWGSGGLSARGRAGSLRAGPASVWGASAASHGRTPRPLGWVAREAAQGRLWSVPRPAADQLILILSGISGTAKTQLACLSDRFGTSVAFLYTTPNRRAVVGRTR